MFVKIMNGQSAVSIWHTQTQSLNRDKKHEPVNAMGGWWISTEFKLGK